VGDAEALTDLRQSTPVEVCHGDDVDAIEPEELVEMCFSLEAAADNPHTQGGHVINLLLRE
jgi:hypothetical protein